MPRLQVGTTLTATALALALLLPYVRSQQGSPNADPRAALLANNVSSLRIEFGHTDKEPRSWKGQVSATGGEVLTVRNWHPRPGDQVAGTSWDLRTRPGVNFVLRAWEMERLTEPARYLNLPGVIVDTTAQQLSIETANGTFTVRPAELQPGAPTPFLDGAVRVERTTAAEAITPGGANNDFPALLRVNNAVWAAWVSFQNERNDILLRRYDGSNWSAVETLPTGHTDIFLVKLGLSQGQPVAVWSAQMEGNFDLYASRFVNDKWSAAERLSTNPQPDIYHAVATDSKGALWVTWQGFRNGKSDIFARRLEASGWTAEERISSSPANDWTPAVATDANGQVHIGWDTYDKGNYDVMLRSWSGTAWSEPSAIAGTPKFEAGVSLACDKDNRLWATWGEAGMDWGKDTGFLPRKQGTPLYRDRWIGVAVREGGRWMEPAIDVNASLPAAIRSHNDRPEVATAGDGRVWLLFRHRNLRIKDTPADTPAHRAAWELHATTWDGNAWRRPMALPFSQGRQDMTIGLAAWDNGLLAAWPTDNRDNEDYLFTRSEVYLGKLALPAASAPAGPTLRERLQPQLKVFPTHYEEAKDLDRIHGYTLASGGKTYRIYRGDTHRHTEFSMDGNNDGSLLDAYRYAIDAAELDFMLVSEHNGSAGPDLPYINWLLQQTADIFSVTGKFTPFYGYERSVVYPNGHRNVLFAKRGVPTLPIPASEQKGQTGAAMLYEYLKKNGGIAISHTSASSMGTDWRDNDKDVEPLVEIYQGDRVSAEYEGAPKAAFAGNPASAPGGFRPAGYVWNAWAKGYKLGIQAASDHLSTHISYACTLATDFTRQGLIDAMKQRHSYGATDNIILDYRMRTGGKEYLQGDIADVNGAFELSVKIIGTQPVRQIDIVRSNAFLHTKNPMQREVDFTFRDNLPLKGESYYYVRVIQADEQMAWSSPIWINRK